MSDEGTPRRFAKDVAMQIAEQAEQAKHDAGATPPLRYEDLRSLADRSPPPVEWYEEDADAIVEQARRDADVAMAQSWKVKWPEHTLDLKAVTDYLVFLIDRVRELQGPDMALQVLGDVVDRNGGRLEMDTGVYRCAREGPVLKKDDDVKPDHEVK